MYRQLLYGAGCAAFFLAVGRLRSQSRPAVTTGLGFDREMKNTGCFPLIIRILGLNWLKILTTNLCPMFSNLIP